MTGPSADSSVLGAFRPLRPIGAQPFQVGIPTGHQRIRKLPRKDFHGASACCQRSCMCRADVAGLVDPHLPRSKRQCRQTATCTYPIHDLAKALPPGPAWPLQDRLGLNAYIWKSNAVYVLEDLAVCALETQSMWRVARPGG